MDVNHVCMGVWTNSALCYSYNFLRSPMHVCRSHDIYQLSFCVSFHECWKHQNGWQYSLGRWLSAKSQYFEYLSLGPSIYCDCTVSLIPVLGHAVRSWVLTRGHPVRGPVSREGRKRWRKTHISLVLSLKADDSVLNALVLWTNCLLGLWRDITAGLCGTGASQSLATALGQRVLSRQWMKGNVRGGTSNYQDRTSLWLEGSERSQI